jgi:hypothetical protein
MYTGIPVAFASGEAESYSTAGQMCATPQELASDTTVQLLIHGATYNHTYWSFGTIDGVRYSYARDVAAAGYPTFAIDEIGAGCQGRPKSHPFAPVENAPPVSGADLVSGSEKCSTSGWCGGFSRSEP